MTTRNATITNASGPYAWSDLAWTARLVETGDRYGLNDCLVHDDDEPLIEFYDLRFTENFGPRGQFVSRYYLSTFLDVIAAGSGLDLDGGIPAWTLDAEAAAAAVTLLGLGGV